MVPLFSPAEKAALAPVFQDPVRLAGGIFGMRPWDLQRRIMRAVFKPHASVAVKSCHSSGKTFLASRLVPAFLLRYPQESIVLTTSPTFRQVKILWREIQDAIKHSRLPLPIPTTTEWRLSEKCYAMGLSTDDPNRFQGYHAKHILIIVDEAQGLLASIWDAIEGIRAGGDVRVLMQGNPTVPGGHYQDAFGRHRSTWNTFTISAFDTPNLAGVSLEQLLAMDDDALGVAPQPYLTTRRWVRERHTKWGPDHPMWYAKVLGQFPAQLDTCVYSMTWLERATEDPEPMPPADHKRVIQVGIDVAGPGEDETTLCARVGGVIIDSGAWSAADPRGEILLRLSALHSYPGCVLGPVVVDVAGIGWYLARHLADQGFDVRGFNAGGKPLLPDKFVNQKAEAYWALREWFERDAIRGLTDEETHAQLASIRYLHTSAGRVEIESKDDAKKRGEQSPDRAEALVMAFCRVPDPDKRLVFGGPGTFEISPV